MFFEHPPAWGFLLESHLSCALLCVKSLCWSLGFASRLVRGIPVVVASIWLLQMLVRVGVLLRVGSVWALVVVVIPQLWVQLP